MTASVQQSELVDELDELEHSLLLEKTQQAFAEVFEAFGFKANHGRIWGVLFACTTPLSQRELMRLSGLSSGLISQSLAELGRYGMVKPLEVEDRRELLYQLEDNMAKVVSSILSRREERVISRLIERMKEIKLELAINERDSSRTRERLRRIEQILALGHLARSIFQLIGKLSHYSYQTVKLGAGVLSRLHVPELPKWFEHEHIPYQDVSSRPLE
ncbi:MAG: hypothetical protein CL920_16795 [Deltaproteobacteria bacterium]|nr:hypothetical protein [Deltaproteobacteria bacterium]MBU50339.1 hypothetical protein [Deltaproteobacteria bacterium]|tara:strand:- start:488 stop:1135 length:648 start_codon:yes stop_codon:yes gene_type:complete